jgi:hypothetical protein
MDSALPVRWIKSVGGDFLDLLRLNLDSSYFERPRQGVYVIWHTGPNKASVIRVGQGNIRDRLIAHKSDPQVTQFSSYGQLKVSWIIVDPVYFDGVEAFLYDYYKPAVGERKTVQKLIPVTPLLSL